MVPSTNKTYWRGKIEKNQARDRRIGAELRKLRWRVVRIWEHDVAKAPAKVARRVRNLLTA